MGLKMVVVEKPEKDKDDSNEEAPKDDPPPAKDDGSPKDSPPKNDKSSPSNNEGAGGGNRVGGPPPPGDGNRGGVFENHILYQLSEMRREQREESWKNYERTVMLQKEIEAFRRDTDDKIAKVQLLLRNTALRLLGSILLLLAGAMYLLPYVKEYVDMVWTQESMKEMFKKKKEP